MHKPSLLLISGVLKENNACNYTIERFLSERYTVDRLDVVIPKPKAWQFLVLPLMPLPSLWRRRRQLRSYQSIVVMNLVYASAIAVLRLLLGRRWSPGRLIVLDVGSTMFAGRLPHWVRAMVRRVAFSFDGILCLARSGVEFWKTEMRYQGAVAIAYLPAGDEYFSFPMTNGSYIFSGGRYGRDFPTLLSAVAGLHETVVIVSDAANRAGVALPPGTDINLVWHEEISYVEYARLLAAASVVVIPLMPTVYHTGQTVLVQAMAMGKVVVVSDGPGTHDYIENGVDGILVEPGNSAQLRAVLQQLKADPALVRRIACAARKRALRDFTEEAFARRLMEMLG